MFLFSHDVVCGVGVLSEMAGRPPLRGFVAVGLADFLSGLTQGLHRD